MMRRFGCLVLTFGLLALPGPATAQGFDVGGLVGGIMQGAIRADQQRRAREEERAIRAEQAQRRRERAAQIKREQRERAAAERKAEEARRADEKAAREREEKLAKVAPAAKEAVEEAAAFIRQNPSSPSMLSLVEAIGKVNAALDGDDPNVIADATTALSSALQKDPAFAEFAAARAQARKEETARYLADVIARAKAQEAFLVGFVAQNPASEEAIGFIPTIKNLDTGLKKPELANLRHLTQTTDYSIRTAGLYEKFTASLTPAPASEEAASSEVADEAPAGSPAPFTKVAETTKNAFLLKGDLGDIVFLRNASGQAPHIVKNLRGDIVFNSGIARVCSYQHKNVDTLAPSLRETVHALGAETIRIQATCADDGLLGYDVIVLRRGDFLNEKPEYAFSLLKEIENGDFVLLSAITQADQDSRNAAEAKAASEIEADVLKGTRDGYGLAFFPTNSSVICAVVSVDQEGHRRVLLGLADRVSAALNGSPVIQITTIDDAFVGIKRHNCGAVYGSAGALKELIPALKRDRVDYRISSIWISNDDVSAAQALVEKERAKAQQEAAERARRVEEQRKLGALRAADEAATAARRQADLRSKFGKTARALAASISDEVREEVEDGKGPALAKFPRFSDWFQDVLSDRWEVMSFNSDLADYGVSNWKGRSLETVFTTVKLRLRNRILGEYRDTCFVFGQIVDHEFSRTRDPVEALCEEGRSIKIWQRTHVYESRWIVR